MQHVKLFCKGIELKKLLFAFLFFLLSGQAFSQSAITNDGYPACLKKEWLDDLVKFSVAKDLGSHNAYLNSKKCIILKGGIKVTLTESPGAFGGTAGFAVDGVKFWTIREALKYR